VTRGALEEQRQFCEAVRPRLVAALAHYCGEVELAEELAQDALLKACRRWPTVREMSSPLGWCYRVGVNAANSWFRRQGAERRAKRRLRSQPFADGDDGHTDRLAVRAALRHLTSEQRAVVILRFYLGLSPTEIAAEKNSTPGAVRALTHRALKVLRAELDIDDATLDEEVRDGS
jgi:RNA polymerase sigma factor (sigma-70 family)